jgi:hypothetical protein
MRISITKRMVQRTESSPTLLRLKINFEIILELTVEPNHKIFNKLATNRSILFPLLVQYLANRIFTHICFHFIMENPLLHKVNIDLQNYKLQHS